jgi:hypothetical protein
LKLNNDEIFALADYLRHQLAKTHTTEGSQEEYFVRKASDALIDLANERADLQHQLALINEARRLQEVAAQVNELIGKFNNNH